MPLLFQRGHKYVANLEFIKSPVEGSERGRFSLLGSPATWHVWLSILNFVKTLQMWSVCNTLLIQRGRSRSFMYLKFSNNKPNHNLQRLDPPWDPRSSAIVPSWDIRQGVGQRPPGLLSVELSPPTACWTTLSACSVKHSTFILHVLRKYL